MYYQANLIDQAGMARLLPPEPPPLVPKLDKRTLPPPLRQTIVDLHAEYPEHHVDEIARIIYAQFGRRPSAQTIKLTLANGPKPSRTTHRFPPFSEMTDPRERRLAIIKLHYVDLTLDSSDLFKSNEWQFHIINVQRRMGDWYFETAQSWEDLVAHTKNGCWITTSKRCAMSAHVESLSQKGKVGAIPLGHGTHLEGKPEGENSMSRKH